MDNRSVLVVEDEIKMLDVVKSFLESNDLYFIPLFGKNGTLDTLNSLQNFATAVVKAPQPK